MDGNRHAMCLMKAITFSMLPMVLSRPIFRRGKQLTSGAGFWERRAAAAAESSLSDPPSPEPDDESELSDEPESAAWPREAKAA